MFEMCTFILQAHSDMPLHTATQTCLGGTNTDTRCPFLRVFLLIDKIVDLFGADLSGYSTSNAFHTLWYNIVR